MKKLVVIMAVGTVVLSSCKKDWTCACSVNGVNALNDVIENKTKKDAESECKANNGSAYGYTFDCELKK